MNSEVYSTVDRVYEVCESELEEYAVLTYEIVYTRYIDSENDKKIKLLKARMQAIESLAIEKVKNNFTKRNHDRYKCALLTLVKEFERIDNESVNRVKSELKICDNYVGKYKDIEEEKWIDEVSNPVYREYLVESAINKHKTTFEKYTEEFGSIKLSVYYDETILEEYERLSYLYLKTSILDENNIEKINRFKNRLWSIKSLSDSEMKERLNEVQSKAYTLALLNVVKMDNDKTRVLKKD